MYFCASRWVTSLSFSPNITLEESQDNKYGTFGSSIFDGVNANGETISSLRQINFTLIVYLIKYVKFLGETLKTLTFG